MAISTQDAEISLQNMIYQITGIRIIISLLIIGWGIGVSIGYFQSKNADDKDKIDKLNKIWFGESPIFKVLLQIWIFSIILLILIIFLPISSKITNAVFSNARREYHRKKFV